MSTGSKTIALQQAVRDAGVVGAGGAGFPTHIKLAGTCDIIIANGVECEPLLQSDKYIMETDAEKISAALELVVRELGADKGIIGIKKKNGLAVEEMEKAVAPHTKLSLYLLDNFYPAGDEFTLVYEITGKIVPEGGIPLAVGLVDINVETHLKIYAASFESSPVMHRTVTCVGEVKEPKVLRVPVGTAARDVVSACGGALVEEPALIIGGPMMGSVTFDLDTPVDKTTGGLIVLGRNHELVQRKIRPLEVQVRLSRTVCCQCVLCSELCPREMLGHDLYPHLIMRQINYGLDVPEEILAGAALCCECGICEVFACPMGLSPSFINGIIKTRFAEEGYKPQFEVKELLPHEMREGRKIPASRIVQRCRLEAYDLPIYDRGGSLDPERVEIPLIQHIGAPARAVVSTGSRVKAGELLGEIPEDSLGARVHASIDGTVTVADENRMIITAGGA